MRPVTRRVNRLLATVLTAAVALALGACGNGGGGTSSGLRGVRRTPPLEVGSVTLPDASNGGRAYTTTARPSGLLVVYFGYTSCPDLCPTTLSNIGLALDKIGASRAARVDVAMVTVDPERDTTPVLASYVSHFFSTRPATAHGLRGDDQAQLDVAEHAFGVQVQIAPHASGENYAVAHTAFTYVVDNSGTVVDEWPFGITANDMASDLGVLLGQASRPGTATNGIVVANAWARPTADASTSAAVYLTLKNAGTSDDTLLGVSIDGSVAGSAQLQTTQNGDSSMSGMMSMASLGSMVVSAGENMMLMPGGLHVMLDGLVKPLVAGEQLTLTLHFRSAGDVNVPVAVRDTAP